MDDVAPEQRLHNFFIKILKCIGVLFEGIEEQRLAQCPTFLFHMRLSYSSILYL